MWFAGHIIEMWFNFDYKFDDIEYLITGAAKLKNIIRWLETPIYDREYREFTVYRG